MSDHDAQRAEELLLKKRALLFRQLQARREREQLAQGSIARQSRETNVFPVSFAQQRLWFLNQLAPGAAIYNIHTAVYLDGALDLAALRHSLSAIMARHEVLRTAFRAQDGQPVQVIGAPSGAGTWAMPLIDLRALPAHAREGAARALARAEAARPFDLVRGPLLRVVALRLAATEYVLLLTMHHIISDGWSTPILIEELQSLYAAEVAGRPSLLPDLPIQYADYAVWQREWLRGANDPTQSPLQTQLAYWKAQLAGLPALALPADRPRPPLPTFRGASVALTLAPPLCEALLALGQAEEATPFMTLLAAWMGLLARYSGQDDVAVGTPIANRARKEIQPLIGFFVNTLVLRASLAGAPSFREALRRVRRVCLGAYAHQELPFEQIVEALAPTRDLSRNPLFQVVFTLEHAPAAAAELPGLTLRPLPVESEAIPFDLQLSLVQSEAGLAGTLEYSADLFHTTTIARMLRHFQALLDAAAADPGCAIAALPLLSAAERWQVLGEWNDTASGVGVQGSGVSSTTSDSWCVHELFAAQAARAPDMVAIVLDPANDERRTTNDEGGRGGACPARTQHLTYNELDRRANRLAHHLRGLGVGPEQPIALRLARSPELAIAILGVLKAGGAFVPLDPTYPAERLDFMLRDSGARVLITTNDVRCPEGAQTNGSDRLPAAGCQLPTDKTGQSVTLSPCHLVHLDTDWPIIAQQPGHAPESGVTPINLAYLIYTSGTTGRPKAVLADHRNLAGVLRASRERFGFRSTDSMPWIASAAFDIALFELFNPLLAGGTLRILAPQQVLDLTRLIDDLAQVTLFHSVPSLMRQIVQTIRAEGRARRAYARMRMVFVGGDSVPPDLLAALADVFPAAQIRVLYGPTEGTIICTCYAPPAGAPPHRRMIGTPLPNALIRICDRRGQLVPIGVVGELCVGGPGVTRGYLGRPDLTAERFVPNPFAQKSGVRSQESENEAQTTKDEGTDWFIGSRLSSIGYRLYRTGDLARYLPGGAIEFLGRIDQQVKIRGFRIEPGEVEAALARHPAVRACAVVAREDAPGEMRLVAYAVPVEGTGNRGQGTGDGSPRSTVGTPQSNDNWTRSESSSIVHRLSSSNDESEPSSFVLRPSSFVTELRAFLKQTLPAYMIPSAFVLLDALPLTAHGKLDRTALPAPEPARSDSTFVAPRTPVEELLSQLWTELLRREPIGIYDDFFALGGHSLLATQLVARIREAFQVALPLRELFEHPTVAGLAERIARARRDGAEPPAPPRPALRDGPLPLSFAQQRLWFIDQLQPGNPAYNIAIAVRVDGRLDPAALDRSLGAVVRRHEILRTTFALIDGQPAQVVAPAQASTRAAPLPLIDLRALPEVARQSAARRIAREEARRSFDLARGPLLRATLVRLSPGSHIALLALHHIIADGWSMDVLVRELTATYAATVAGYDGALPELPIQYGDYALWQREWLRGAALDQQLAYWRTQLAGLPALDLPADHPRPPIQSFRGASRGFALPDAVSAGLRALSRRAGVTLFMTLLAAWQTLLGRYSRQDDLAVGTPIAGRTHTATEPLIGCFINTLVLRADLSGNPPFLELARRVREVCLDAYAHQDLPFEQIVDALQPERGLNRNPLFQVLFSLQNAPPQQPSPPGLALRPMAIEQGTTQFDLLLSLEEAPAGLAGTLDYSTDLFDAPTIARLLRHFQTLLAAIAAGPELRIDELPLLSRAERQQLLREWNDTAARLAMDASLCFHDLFAAQAARTPDTVAVVFDAMNDQRRTTNGEGGRGGACPAPTQHLTYNELDRRANQLAHRLRALGVRPEARVGICMQRGVELLVALLGIMKAGGAYLPLDPALPPERLAFMIDDAQAAVILTQDHLADDLPASWAYVVRIDADWPAIARSPASDPRGGARPANLAYALYTSGSTGQPKGVLVPHAGLVSYLAWCARRYLAPDGRGAPVHSPLGFDLTITSLFAPLLAGQAVALLPESFGPAALSAALERSAAWSLVKLTPAHLELLGQQLAPASAGHARALIIGGEALRAEQLAFWRTNAPATRLINEYGPTETVVGCCVYQVPVDAPLSGALPIGRPISNTQLYLLDRALRPVPIGVAGVLYVGGARLARGYLARPDLTAARFIPNPFNDCRLQIADWRLGDSSICNLQSAICNRLYRTGDLARYRPDGVIEFLGRADRQIKLRGYRIEPGEIEAALGRHPLVRASVVVARADDASDRRLVAYIVQESGVRGQGSGGSASETLIPDPRSLIPELRDFLKQTLPDYMLPAAFVLLDELPHTPNGKIDHAALPAPDSARPAEAPSLPPRTEVERTIAAIWQEVLHLDAVGIDDNFFDLGGHSLLMVQVLSRIRATMLADLSMVDLFQYPTISALSAFLARTQGDLAAQQRLRAKLGARQPAGAAAQPIAIIGMSGRFPGAPTVEDFWRNLRDGVESIRFFTDQELIDAGADPALLSDPSYVKAHAALDEVELFDAAFFGYAAREAEIMDPQQRLFLECAHEALERAGYDPQRYPGRIGVYAGVSMNSYIFNLLAAPDVTGSLDGLQLVLGNDKDFLSTRVSYKLNLSGPSVAVQTACSTSLVAAHLACKSLRDGECDIALAGGVSVGVPQTTGYRYVEGGIGSPDGHCRAFDARAQGAISGSGLGIVVLKRLDDALAGGDAILAVIAGSAVNNDGADKVGYTAPSVAGQAAVIAEAQALAGVDAAGVGYVEAHGTATPLGDPIEVAALTQAFRLSADRSGFCALGSVKTNIGHLDAAAGVAGLIKTILALQHRQIPPSLHFETPNPNIDFAHSPFFVNASLIDWPDGSAPRRAGVSSFGLGGTNAHLVLEEAPPREPGDPSRPWQLLLLSANTPTALDALTARLAAHLERQPDLDLADVAYTLQVGRRILRHRRMLVCRDTADAAHALAAHDPRRLATHAQDERERPVVFMFPGQGAQHVGMGRELYDAEPEFRAAVDHCAALLERHLGLDIRELLYPTNDEAPDKETRRQGDKETSDLPVSLSPGLEPGSRNANPHLERVNDQSLDQTWLAQPALFIVEYALARLWMSWGVRPEAMIGHSIGEYVAACLAGVFSLEDALALVAARGRLMQALPPGAMLAVPLSEEELRPLLGDDLDLAAINGPALCVVSGVPAAIERLGRRLAERGVEGRRLRTSHAFHSAMLDPIIARFREQVARVRLHAPQTPFLSNLTGGWISAAQATSPDYWARHLREPVRFADGLDELLREPGRVLLEIGPGQSLSSFARQHPALGAGHVVQPAMRHPRESGSDVAVLLTALGKLWLAGCAIDWSGVYAHERRRRALLPTYPFERQRYWIDPARRSPGQPRREAAPVQRGLDGWFYAPIWKQTPPLRPARQAEPARWLILSDDRGLGARLAQRLEQARQLVVVARAGEGFARLGEREYTLDPRRGGDYVQLLDELRAQNILPDRIVHLWSAAPAGADQPPGLRFEAAQELGCYSLLLLAQALGRQRQLGAVHIAVVTCGMQDVADGELLHPEQATILGPCRVIPQEHPNITCQSIDIAAPDAEAPRAERSAGQLLAELLTRRPDPLIAYRGNQRWVQLFEAVQLGSLEQEESGLRERGVYLITGGLGAIGLQLAGYLARTARARLILVGRSAFPARDEWDRWLAHAGEHDTAALRIRRLREIEAAGAEVLIARADVADADQLRAAIDQAVARYGALNGVIHAAGVAGEQTVCPVQETDQQVCARHFRPKAHGLLALADALHGHELDFVVLCSSLSTVLGGLGFAAYAAANAFMDAFAQAESRPGATPWISVDWDGWQLDAAQAQPSPLGARGAAPGIALEEGAEAFARITALAPGARVVVSTADLHDRIAQWVERVGFGANGQPAAQERLAQHPRPTLQNEYVAPRGELEQQIAAIWQEILGVEPIGVYDDFFALGGHSLLAIQIMARLRDALAVELPLRDLFEAATVADLAGQIARAGEQDHKPQQPAVVPVARAAYRVKRSALPGGDQEPQAK